jgi:hypothetical protein
LISLVGGILYQPLVQNRQSLLQGHRKLPDRIEKRARLISRTHVVTKSPDAPGTKHFEIFSSSSRHHAQNIANR